MQFKEDTIRELAERSKETEDDLICLSEFYAVDSSRYKNVISLDTISLSYTDQVNASGMTGASLQGKNKKPESCPLLSLGNQ